MVSSGQIPTRLTRHAAGIAGPLFTPVSLWAGTRCPHVPGNPGHGHQKFGGRESKCLGGGDLVTPECTLLSVSCTVCSQPSSRVTLAEPPCAQLIGKVSHSITACMWLCRTWLCIGSGSYVVNIKFTLNSHAFVRGWRCYLHLLGQSYKLCAFSRFFLSS